MVRLLLAFVGFCFIGRGFMGFSTPGGAFGGLVVLIMGVLILPPIWAKLPLPGWTRWLVVVCGLAAGLSFETPNGTGPPVQQTAAADPNAPNAMRDLIVKRKQWEKGGFGAVGLHSFSVYNRSKVNSYRDVSFTFYYMAESGTVIAKTEKVVYRLFPPGKTVRIKELNTGFIDQQAQKATVEVTP